MTVIFVNEITHQYLMNKSKENMASLTLWIIGNQERDRKEFDELLSKIVECLDDRNCAEALTLIKSWERAHRRWEPEK
jgi:hypothetical protein